MTPTNRIAAKALATVSALDCAKSGLDRSKLLSYATNSWSLGLIARDTLKITSYFTRRWHGNHLRAIINEGTIHDVESDKLYAVIYRNCTPSQAFNATDVMISFRATCVGNFALVSPSLKDTESHTMETCNGK